MHKKSVFLVQHLNQDSNNTTPQDNSDNLEINGTSGDVKLSGKYISKPLKSTSISGGKIHIKLPTKESFMPSTLQRNKNVRTFLLRRYNVLTHSPLKLNVSIKDVEWKKKISKAFLWK